MFEAKQQESESSGTAGPHALPDEKGIFQWSHVDEFPPNLKK